MKEEKESSSITSSRRASNVTNAPEIKVDDNKLNDKEDEMPEDEIPRPSKIVAKNEPEQESNDDKVEEPESPKMAEDDKNVSVDTVKS
jgi:hypothetical protein